MDDPVLGVARILVVRGAAREEGTLGRVRTGERAVGDRIGVDVLMPQMGTSIVEGTVVAWNRAVGDRVELDEALCEISTDKVESECPSPSAGVLTEILVKVGDNITGGQIIAKVGNSGGVSEPQLHFELRQGKKPVDPRQFLAPAPHAA